MGAAAAAMKAAVKAAVETEVVEMEPAEPAVAAMVVVETALAGTEGAEKVEGSV